MKYRAYNNTTFKSTSYYKRLPPEEKHTFDILSRVFHFKVNDYVLEKLIHWDNIPNDPMYRLVFPRKEMISENNFEKLSRIVLSGVDEKTFALFISQLKNQISPNIKAYANCIPVINGKAIPGMYQNFKTILSLGPSPMTRTCHSHCSYCFRWIMFNDNELQKNASYQNPSSPVAFLEKHPEIKDVLFTGADPLVLNANILKKYIDPVLEINSVEIIRISSKSIAWWPYRYTTDKDANALLELFKYIQSKGKHLNFTAHFTHPRELENEVVKEAIERIQATGAIIRCQGPLVKGINDSAETWSQLWAKQIALGMIPYYMFVEADHNLESCFRVPLARALQIFQKAQKKTTGLARTVRGPVFMNDIHRILLDGVITLSNKKFFVLKSLQAPPGNDDENNIKLIPFDEKITRIDNLNMLFN